MTTVYIICKIYDFSTNITHTKNYKQKTTPVVDKRPIKMRSIWPRVLPSSLKAVVDKLSLVNSTTGKLYSSTAIHLVVFPIAHVYCTI